MLFGFPSRALCPSTAPVIAPKMPRFARSPIFLAFCTILAFSLTNLPCISAWTCDNSCGGVTVKYPFGTYSNCGSPSFQKYLNCTDGNFLFSTPTGTYTIQSIDYTNNIMIIQDPHMSTCSSMQLSGAFGLPIGAPFSFASYDRIVLIGCSATSSLYSSQSCDSSSSQICQSLYNCPGISDIGLTQNGPTSTCCVYSNSLLGSPPYEINLPLLECSTYTSIYHSNNFQRPASSWSYGIALQFTYEQSNNNNGYNNNGSPYCEICEEAEDSHGSLSNRPCGALWTGGLGTLLAAFFMLI